MLDTQRQPVVDETRRESVSKSDAPEFLLVMVISFLLWSIGFVDLLARQTPMPADQFLGPYSKNVVALLLGHGMLFLLWLGLLIVPGSHLWVSRILGAVQANNLLAAAALAIIGTATWHILTWPDWLKFPGFSTALFVFLLMMGAILLFSRWRWSGRSQIWRRLALTLLVLGVGLEGIAQGAAYLGRLPAGQHLDGGYVPRGRVYQDREGLGNGQANNYGWYYPDFRLAEGSRRVALLGDTFVQALQIRPEEHMGVRLEGLLAAGQAESARTEVLALGHPGYGSGLYLDLEMLDFALQAFELDEIVIVMHLGNDLRNTTTPSDLDVYFDLDEDGEYRIHPDNFHRWHDVAHYALVGYEPFHPLRVLKSHYLTPTFGRGLAATLFPSQAVRADQVVDDATSAALDIPGVRGVIERAGATIQGHTLVEKMDLIDTPGWSNFLFEPAPDPRVDEAFAITEQLLARFHDRTSREGVTLRLVTIPVFPAEFYHTFSGFEWSPELHPYDLFLPEKRLAAFAGGRGIPMLSMGQYMRGEGLTTEAVQALYHAGGTGHLTPQGHALYAEAIYTCFYANQAEGDPTLPAGCSGESP